MLLSCIDKKGKKWSQIAKHIPTRSTSAARNRLQRLERCARDNARHDLPPIVEPLVLEGFVPEPSFVEPLFLEDFVPEPSEPPVFVDDELKHEPFFPEPLAGPELHKFCVYVPLAFESELENFV